jgi:hypothetical protein
VDFAHRQDRRLAMLYHIENPCWPAPNGRTPHFHSERDSHIGMYPYFLDIQVKTLLHSQLKKGVPISRCGPWKEQQLELFTSQGIFESTY